jgi:IS5 family transposase
VGVDSKTQVFHSLRTTPANVADSAVLGDLLHDAETRVWGDQAYRGQKAVIKAKAPRAQDHTHRRYRHRGVVNEEERAKNRTKSKVWAKGEHSFLIIKRAFGFAKVRYRGLKTNTNRLFVACGGTPHQLSSRFWGGADHDLPAGIVGSSALQHGAGHRQESRVNPGSG